MTSRADLLEAAYCGINLATAVILKIYAMPFEVRHKIDKSPVTRADEEAERLIIAALKHAAPDIPVVAEEQVAVSGPPPIPTSRYWLVDPLDGTRGFIDHSDEFSINIGLIEDGWPVLGVIGVPTQNLVYAAAGPGTATRQRHGKLEKITARIAPATPVVLSSRLHGPSRRVSAYLETVPGAVHRPLGSAIKFCLIAEGAADHYPRYGETCEWDTAAGQAILEAAGGSVTTFDGARLGYGKPCYRNPSFVARGRT